MTKRIVKEDFYQIYKKVILILEINTHTQNKMYSEAITVQISTMRAQTWKYMNAYINRLTEAEIKLKY